MLKVGQGSRKNYIWTSTINNTFDYEVLLITSLRMLINMSERKIKRKKFSTLSSYQSQSFLCQYD